MPAILCMLAMRGEAATTRGWAAMAKTRDGLPTMAGLEEEGFKRW